MHVLRMQLMSEKFAVIPDSDVPNPLGRWLVANGRNHQKFLRKKYHDHKLPKYGHPAYAVRQYAKKLCAAPGFDNSVAR